CGCPVITSRVSSLPEVAGNAAFLINPFRTEEIAAAMLNLFRSRSLREKLRETGLKQARNFSWEKCAGETLAVYEEVLSERLSH
ncbi:MAG TPA: glycosyltransferase family 1 protein, partial [bacterium]|nr:glycosyltransferase family 1 protein [bacterium]